MKIEFLTSLFLIATSLSARMAIQRIEQALVATVAEHGAIGISAREKSVGPASIGWQTGSWLATWKEFVRRE